MQPLQKLSAFTLPDHEPPCAAIDIAAELRHWESCYARQPFHRNGTPFRHYVATLKFAYDTYLLAHHDTLEDLMPTLALRYERNVAPSARLEWSAVQALVACVWQRLRAPLQNEADMLLPPDALDERAIVAEAIRAGGRVLAGQ